MGINNLKLSNKMAAGLYPASLVVPLQKTDKNSTETSPAATAANTQSEDNDEIPFHSIGNNTKNILILQKSDNHTHIADEQLSFLIKILAACRLGLDDVAIVNQVKYPSASYKEITAFFQAKNVLLFDIEPTAFGLPISFPFYQVQTFAGCTFLSVPSLQELETNKAAKKECWTALQKIFNL